MAKTSTKKNATAPSITGPGTSAGRPKTASRPRLSKTTVMNAISQLRNARGSTIQSILCKLQRRSGGENITRVQLKRALERLLDDGLIREAIKDRFSLSSQPKESAAQAQTESKTKNVATADKLQNLCADKTSSAEDVKTSSNNPAVVQTKLNKASSVADDPVGSTNSTLDLIISIFPPKADREAGSAQKLANNRLSENHGPVSPVTSGKMDGSLVGNRPEASLMDAKCEPVSTPCCVNETNTEKQGAN